MPIAKVLVGRPNQDLGIIKGENLCVTGPNETMCNSIPQYTLKIILRRLTFRVYWPFISTQLRVYISSFILVIKVKSVPDSHMQCECISCITPIPNYSIKSYLLLHAH